VRGGEDLLDPNPVVDILEVSQGAFIFQKGVDWQQSGTLGLFKKTLPVGKLFLKLLSDNKLDILMVHETSPFWFGYFEDFPAITEAFLL
jgi:hypothetical protein